MCGQIRFLIWSIQALSARLKMEIPGEVDARVLLQNRAKSALVGSFIGTGWMFWGTAFIPSHAALWRILITLVACVVLGWSISRARFVRKHAAVSSDRESSPALGRAFWMVVALEFVFAGGTALLLMAAHRSHLIPVAIAIIVGLHFLPLAKVLGRPPLFIVGVAMVVIAALSMAIPSPGVRNLALCSGIGLFMWARTFSALNQVVSNLKALPIT